MLFSGLNGHLPALTQTSKKKKKSLQVKKKVPTQCAHAFNPSTWEAETTRVT